MENVKDVTGDNAFDTVLGMIHFQNVHNELRKDFLVIYGLTLESMKDATVPNALIRSCIKELFSLIEADVYLYNQYNPYEGFDDKAAILDKFKKTFKHHGKEFNKSEVVIAFNSKYFEILKAAKILRDTITHPKSKQSIQVDKSNLDLTFEVYNAYTNFVNELMTGTALSFKVPDDFLFKR